MVYFDAPVSRKGFFCSFLLSFCSVTVKLLSYFKITFDYEVYSIDHALIFAVNFLAPYELYGLHVVKDVFNDESAQVCKNSKAFEKFYDFLKLSFLFLPDGPFVVFELQRGEACVLRAHYRGIPTAFARFSCLS